MEPITDMKRKALTLSITKTFPWYVKTFHLESTPHVAARMTYGQDELWRFSPSGKWDTDQRIAFQKLLLKGEELSISQEEINHCKDLINKAMLNPSAENISKARFQINDVGDRELSYISGTFRDSSKEFLEIMELEGQFTIWLAENNLI